MHISSHVGLQTAHSWTDAGVLLGGRIRGDGGGVAFETIKLSG